MKNKFAIIMMSLIVIGVMIGICMVRNNKKTEGLDVLNKNKISHIEIQHKNDLMTITDEEKIEKIRNLFDEKMKREKSLEEKKGWTYSVSVYDENNKKANIIYILDDNSIVVDGKGYKYNGQFVSIIDEILGISVR